MIGEALRLLRTFHDMKQFELAERLNISRSHLSEIESGQKLPSMDLIQRFSTEFGIPTSSILFFAEELPNAKSGEKVRAKIASKVVDILRFVEGKADAKI